MKMLKDANPSRYAPANGAEYPRSPFGDALKQIAQLIKADVGLEVAFAELGQLGSPRQRGGADRPARESPRRLRRAASPRSSRDLGDRMSDVVVLTMSEFGRAVAENGNRGTDHGHGNAMMVIGGGVRGGKVYGKWPGLAREQRYEGRDLAVTTDFRDVFAEVVRRSPRPDDTSTCSRASTDAVLGGSAGADPGLRAQGSRLRATSLES